MNELETSLQTEDGTRVSFDQYDGGLWLALQARRCSMHAILNREEAEQLLANLQRILGVTA